MKARWMTGSSTKPSNHMPQLDSLRGLAVASVVYYHWTPEQYHGGLPLWGGVPLFFVLSGFLISSILLECRAFGRPWYSLRSFYMRRILRIIPLVYLVLFCGYFLRVNGMQDTFVWNITFLTNVYVFLQQRWIGCTGHLWSLAVEEQFYLIWPAIVLWVRPNRLLHSFCGLCFVGFVSLFVSTLVFSNYKMVGVLLPGNLLPLGLGSLLALRRLHPRLIAILTQVSIGALPAFALTTAIISCKFQLPCIFEVSYCCMVVSFFWLVSRASYGFKGVVGYILTLRCLTYLGRISYGIYVLHNFGDFQVGVFCKKILGVSPGALTGTEMLYIKSCATLFGAIASWHVLEFNVNSLKRFFPYR